MAVERAAAIHGIVLDRIDREIIQFVVIRVFLFRVVVRLVLVTRHLTGMAVIAALAHFLLQPLQLLRHLLRSLDLAADFVSEIDVSASTSVKTLLYHSFDQLIQQ